ncbi:MAG: hypothetical protein ASARMPRED_003555 [Alectoria sarmentosa]|nr:MAG: hypothetical protein ASARMPRED_003555 [Alectoria sarmentosa]
MQIYSIRLGWALSTLLTIAQAIQVAHTVQIGPYYARNCKSNINNIVTLLNTLKHVLQPVITDLGSSTSSDAYTTFFKDIANAFYVREVLTNLTKGVSVPPEPGTRSWTPILICVDGRDQVTFSEDGRQVDAYSRCRTLGQAPAMALLTTPYIVICPVFFTHPAIPIQSAASCLTVDPHRNRFAQDGKSLIKYQLWHLLHELVHYYVYATKEAHLDIYGVNACLVLLNVWLGCTSFPIPRSRPLGRGGGLELLEMDSNVTALDANESIALVVQNVSMSAVPPV